MLKIIVTYYSIYTITNHLRIIIDRFKLYGGDY